MVHLLERALRRAEQGSWRYSALLPTVKQTKLPVSWRRVPNGNKSRRVRGQHHSVLS